MCVRGRREHTYRVAQPERRFRVPVPPPLAAATAKGHHRHLLVAFTPVARVAKRPGRAVDEALQRGEVPRPQLVAAATAIIQRKCFATKGGGDDRKRQDDGHAALRLEGCPDHLPGFPTAAKGQVQVKIQVKIEVELELETQHTGTIVCCRRGQGGGGG